MALIQTPTPLNIKSGSPPLPGPLLVQSGPERSPLASHTAAAPGWLFPHPDACRKSCTAAADPRLELQEQPPN